MEFPIEQGFVLPFGWQVSFELADVFIEDDAVWRIAIRQGNMGLDHGSGTGYGKQFVGIVHTTPLCAVVQTDG